VLIEACADFGMLDERTKSVLATPRNANHQHAHLEPVAVDPPVH
jgi:hypothetical protein